MIPKERNLQRNRILQERGALDNLSLRFEVERGFDRLKILNQNHQNSWSGLFPIFKTNEKDDGLALHILNDQHDTVACTAVRLRFIPKSLTKALTDLSFFYDDIREIETSPVHCKVSTELPDRINGTVVYHGATWTHPDWRGKGLARSTSRLIQLFALNEWSPDWIIATVGPLHMPKVAPNAYGFDLIGTWVEFHDPTWGHKDSGEQIALLATSRQGLRARLLGLGGEQI